MEEESNDGLQRQKREIGPESISIMQMFVCLWAQWFYRYRVDGCHSSAL